MNVLMRASLLINLSKKEATEIRARARADMRTVSGYVIFVLVKCMKTSDALINYLRMVPSFRLDHTKKAKVLGPRTTIHIYCSAEQADQIRAAATLRKIPMNQFVLSCLHFYWNTEDGVSKRLAERKKERKSWGSDRELIFDPTKTK
jgi:hypothetical protein